MQEPVTQILHCDAMQYFLFFHLSVSLVATEMKLLFFSTPLSLLYFSLGIR